MKVTGKNALRALALAFGLSMAVASIVTPQHASAAAFNLTTSPLPVSIVTEPGKTVVTPIKVENTGTEPVKIKVSLMKFGAYGDTGQPKIETPDPNDEFVKWATFSQNSFIAQPNVYNTVTLTVKVPKTAAFGYYYAVVFSQDNSDVKVPLGSRQNKVNGAVATLLLLDVNAPGEKRELKVTQFTSEKKFYQYLPASFKIKVKNTGNVHIVPSGNVFISRNKKTTISVLDINNGQGNILPNSNRIFDVEWNDGFPTYKTKTVNNQVVSDKHGRPIKTLQWNLNHVSHLRIGKYYAHMVLVYNDGKRDVPVEGIVSFWVIPWSLILGIILIPTVPAVLVYLLMRWRFRRKYGHLKPVKKDKKGKSKKDVEA